MNPVITIAVLLFGLAIGSFLNVLALRYHPEKRVLGKHIGGRSRCFSCQKTLKWYELMPLLSFIFQRGRCRSCSVQLSIQYPIVELVAGFVTVGLVYGFKNYFEAFDLFGPGQSVAWFYVLLGVWLLAAYALILMSAIDYRLKIIPDEINIFLAVLGAVVVAIKAVYVVPLSFTQWFVYLFPGLNWMTYQIAVHLFAAFIGFAFFGLIILVTRGRGMGIGDMKLAAALGLLMGWPDSLVAFVLSFIVGALWAIGLIIFRAKSLKDEVPFGPFLAIGTLLTVFCGERLLNFYLTLLQ